MINNDDGVWENANHSKLRLKIIICERLHEIEHNFPFDSWNFIRKFLNLYKKGSRVLFFSFGKKSLECDSNTSCFRAYM